MASTSAARGNNYAASSGRIASTAAALSADNQSFIAEIRKALIIVKGIGVDLEKDNEFEKVKELESTVLELLASSDDCAYLSAAIQSVGDKYQPGEQLTDFSNALEAEIKKFKATSPSNPQTNPFYRQFKDAIWNVHHTGQPMPGEEQEDIVVTSTQSNLLNTTCPLTGKPVTELESPVRGVDCKHIYEKDPIMHYIRTKKPHPQCPVAGCPKILQAGRVVCDPLLPIEIDEIRSRGDDDTVHPTMVEDFTELDDD